MKITRRKVLQGLATLPLAATGQSLLGRTAGLPLPEAEGSANGPALYLNIVLHGLMTVIVPRDDARIEIWVPEEDHVYQWGQWDSEASLPGGGAVHTITGVSGGPQSLSALSPANNVVLTNCPVKDASQLGLHCRFSLPFPLQVYSMRRVCKFPYSDPFITDVAAKYLVQQPARLSMVHALRYRVDDQKALTSYGSALQVDPKTNTANLHIWADPVEGVHFRSTETPDGTPTPFDLMIESITTLTCGQPAHYQNRIGGLKLEPAPPGMQHCEKYKRDERETWKCRHKYTFCNSEQQRMHAKIVHCMTAFVYHPKSGALNRGDHKP